MRRCYSLFCRMALTEAFNHQGHGNVHLLIGGSWSPDATAYVNSVDPIVEPFANVAKVSLPSVCNGVVEVIVVVAISLSMQTT